MVLDMSNYRHIYSRDVKWGRDPEVDMGGAGTHIEIFVGGACPRISESMGGHAPFKNLMGGHVPP